MPYLHWNTGTKGIYMEETVLRDDTLKRHSNKLLAAEASRANKSATSSHSQAADPWLARLAVGCRGGSATFAEPRASTRAPGHQGTSRQPGRAERPASRGTAVPLPVSDEDPAARGA